MGISDYVNRLKSAHRERQQITTANRQEKIKVLQAQRQELQEREKVRTTLRTEKKAVRDLRLAPVREKLSGLQKLAKNIKNNKDNALNKNSSPFSGGGIGMGSSSPFAAGSAFRSSSTPKPLPKKKKGITIRIEQ